MNTLLTLSIGMLIGATLMTIVAVIHVDEVNGERNDEEYQKGFKDGYNEAMKDIGG